MNQEKIGKLIAECRKEKKLTQNELANMLGVSDKSVSKWENGKCLPDVSLYKPLCEILGITLNDFFAGEKIQEEEYRKVADENLLSALENSTFTLKDKIDFFKKKWEKDHVFELTLMMIVIVFFIIYGFIKDNGVQYLFMIIGLVSGVIENNKMMAYIERNAYGKNSKISIEEFRSSVDRLEEFQQTMKEFSSKRDAIQYLIKETNLSKKECIEAYDFIMKLDLKQVRK